MVAYAAFTPTIRDRIPPSPTITAMDLILVVLSINCMLCLLRSYLDFYTYDPAVYVFDWKNDPLYLICVVGILAIVLIVIVALVIHKTVWEPSYNNRLGTEKVISDKFESCAWKNPECDELVRDLMSKHPDEFHVLTGDSQMFPEKAV